MLDLNLKPEDFAAAVFHQPNAKFPQRAAKILGFSKEQIRDGLLSPQIGNTYAGASPLGFAAALDNANPGDRILLVSFGSGAGSDAFSFVVTEKITDAKTRAPLTEAYLQRKSAVNYATYTRWRNKIRKH